jgi:hypothetical protein
MSCSHVFYKDLEIEENPEDEKYQERKMYCMCDRKNSRKISY